MNGKFLILQDSADGAPCSDIIEGGYADEWVARKACDQANRIANGISQYYVFCMDGKRGAHPPMNLEHLKEMVRPIKQSRAGKRRVQVQCGEIACFRFK